MNEAVRSWWRGNIYKFLNIVRFLFILFIWVMLFLLTWCLCLYTFAACGAQTVKKKNRNKQSCAFFLSFSLFLRGPAEQADRTVREFYFIFSMRINCGGFMKLITARASSETLSRLFLPVERRQSHRSWPHPSSRTNEETTADSR